MDESQIWQARYDELRAALRHIGAALGDVAAAPARRDAVSQEFVAAWQAIAQHIRRQPASTPQAPLAQPGT